MLPSCDATALGYTVLHRATPGYTPRHPVTPHAADGLTTSPRQDREEPGARHDPLRERGQLTPLGTHTATEAATMGAGTHGDLNK